VQRDTWQRATAKAADVYRKRGSPGGGGAEYKCEQKVMANGDGERRRCLMVKIHFLKMESMVVLGRFAFYLIAGSYLPRKRHSRTGIR